MKLELTSTQIYTIIDALNEHAESLRDRLENFDNFGSGVKEFYEAELKRTLDAIEAVR